MLPDRYELNGNIIYVYSTYGCATNRYEFKRKLICPTEEAARDALMLLNKAYCSDKIASLVYGTWSTTE